MVHWGTVILVVFALQAVAGNIGHTFNLADNLPQHLALMFSMSWFGIPSSDPQGGGLDAAWGNWRWGVDTDTCKIPETTPETCNKGTAWTYAFPNEQRNIASKRRPLNGIYSSSARDAESLARVDLMLSNLRRTCDGGVNARLDAWAVQQNSIFGSSRYQTQGSKTYCPTCDSAYRALNAFFQRAQNASMTNAVMPGLDQTWIFKFYAAVGLQCGSDKTPCINALTQDITDMVKISNQYGSTAVRSTNGLPIILIYVNGALSNAQWSTVLQNARNAAGSDFYVIGTGPGDTTGFFNVFDAMAPWTQADYSITNPTHTQAYNWAAGKHANFITKAKGFPGRVVFGSLTPGFDDYTESWGTCQKRVMPRNPLLVTAATDYLASVGIGHTVAMTWDDWTEGTHFEPDTINGTQILVALKQGLGNLAGELPDPAGDSALNQRWVSYGSARNCNGGKAGIPPATPLPCLSAPTPAFPVGTSGYLRNLNSGYFLTVASDSVVIGNTYTTQGATVFNFGSNSYGSTIQNAASKLYVCAENAGTSNLAADRGAASTWESFQFVPYGGYFYIRSYINNNFVVFGSNEHLLASSPSQSGGSVFAIISSMLSSTTLSGSIKVYSVLNGRYLRVSSSGMLVSTASLSSASTFSVVALSSEGGFGLQDVTTKTYVSAQNSGNGPLLVTAQAATSTQESFLFYATSNSEIAFYSVVNTKLLNVHNNGQVQPDALTYGNIPASALFRVVAV
eukprot:Phypoly_transcript_02441.p1 GENE.Phypoly_transcript_02441~~Phypoly_transcript_02441.p1  ORF type:complete len:736 (+),score=106.56 Phypoly_transcript_02441:574-2781(+)